MIINMRNYRALTSDEIDQLRRQGCSASSWDEILVADRFNAHYISQTQFSGPIRLGAFDEEFSLPGGIRKHAGIREAYLHNVEIGDNCLIGMNAVVMESEVGPNCIIGAGAVIPAGKNIPAGSLVMGVPAKIVRKLEEDEVNAVIRNAREYADSIRLYKDHCEEI